MIQDTPPLLCIVLARCARLKWREACDLSINWEAGITVRKYHKQASMHVHRLMHTICIDARYGKLDTQY